MRVLVSVLSLLSFSGCGHLSYLVQAGKGQWELFNRARPIEEVLRDEKTSPRVRELLAHVARVKAFGESHGLKPTRNYEDYVDLKRRAVVFVVTASPKLELKAKEWRFPIVGGFPYLGWFDPERAKAYADSLKAEGYDVDVRGAQAYSTLGWLRDSVLSTMIPDGEEALAGLVNVILHESVHATFYIGGQGPFNEGLASFVADALTPVYLKTLGESGDRSYKLNRELETKGRARALSMHEAFRRLDALYRSQTSEEEKLTGKLKVLEELKRATQFPREINNATLLAYRTYEHASPVFEKFFSDVRGDWNVFWKKIRTLEEQSFQRSQQEDLEEVLRGLLSRGP